MTSLEFDLSDVGVMLRSRVMTEEISERSAVRTEAGIMVAVGKVVVGVIAAW